LCKLNFKIYIYSAFSLFEICQIYFNYCKSLFTTLKGPKPRVEFKIIGVKPESNEIYLWKPDVVIRYDFTERELEILWGHGFGRAPLAARILPYVHSFAPIQIAKMEEEEAKTYVDVERNNTTK
jgi:hypothetical protein